MYGSPRSLEGVQTSDGGYICVCTVINKDVIRLIKVGPEQ